MATKNKKQEDIQTLDAVDEATPEATEEDKVENGGDTGEGENSGESGNDSTEVATGSDGAVVISDSDDDTGIRPLAADDYVENFEVGGQTLAVRDVEAQDAITQLNSESNSLGNQLSDLSTAYSNFNSTITGAFYENKEYTSFDSVSVANNNMVHIIYSGSDANAPVTTEGDWWWNVITLAATNTRVTQIAWCPFRNRDKVYFRQRHDTSWYGWYALDASLSGELPSLFVNTAFSKEYTCAANSAAQFDLEGNIPSGYTGIALRSVYSGTSGATLAYINVAGTPNIIVRNHTSSAITATATMTVLCARTDFYSG